MSDAAAWERLRHATIDQLVTHVKLTGSAVATFGYTTPEGYPFAAIVVVGSPGNEAVMDAAQACMLTIGQQASFTAAAQNGPHPERFPGLQRALRLIRYERHRPLLPAAAAMLDELERSIRYEMEHGPSTSGFADG